MLAMSLDDLYRRVIMDHYQRPRNKGRIEDGAVTVDLNNPTCGDRISLQMRVEDGIIQEAKFLGEGCSISLASASMMTEAVKGLKVEEALELVDLFSKMMQGEDVDPEKFPLEDIEALMGVAKFPARIKCATLAWKALEQGVRNQQKAD
ncbi:SUF system NifU family Fe-S cluster assembly protein [Thermoactinomyces sp. CICC 10521]|uniref:SUF system NifU family Fe-S cluster assembly protein n=2 Tax=Thermoactinomycetaceae TaxID=186824 RepID=A0A7W2AJ55_9BACL|nr:SUF system NifU family Fe-S cluster assembly protein [Thermoactinomyces daqus]MBH8599027.1 SUF system NifU family Fe-S cluster assembly protein [Thermoactinomyces sp. CICC 10523]MBH8605014.1 SUF system NifU family Fe-S cluster assembly protein [Thermoactinomyces sp. CICC 10522]MBH8608454.1 SUF system NifU family Fe-S cluster assembly protein [Thermoactinomyces sp. CICC 10521]